MIETKINTITISFDGKTYEVPNDIFENFNTDFLDDLLVCELLSHDEKQNILNQYNDYSTEEYSILCKNLRMYRYLQRIRLEEKWVFIP